MAKQATGWGIAAGVLVLAALPARGQGPARVQDYQGAAAAFWLALGSGVEMRRTDYDVPAAVELMRASGMPEMEHSIVASLVEPVSAAFIAEFFEKQATSRPDER